MSWIGFSCRLPNTYKGKTHAEAQAYIDAGLNSKNRRIGSTSFLGVQADGSITLVLHSTPVITYRPNGFYVIDHGTFLTMTTQMWINAFTKCNIYSTYDRKNPGWSLGLTGEITSARVWKCRTCSGTGFDPWQMEQSRRSGGMTHPNSAMGKCWRCDGKGRVDYGSQPVPIVWTHRDGPVLMDADGKFIERGPRCYGSLPYEHLERWSPEYVIQGYTHRMLRAMA